MKPVTVQNEVILIFPLGNLSNIHIQWFSCFVSIFQQHMVICTVLVDSELEFAKKKQKTYPEYACCIKEKYTRSCKTLGAWQLCLLG